MFSLKMNGIFTLLSLYEPRCGNEAWFDPNFRDDINDGPANKMKGHAFIPTISAAGIVANLADFNTKTTWYLPNGTTSLGGTQTMFDQAFINQNNEPHIDEDNGTAPKSTIFQLIQEAK